jgi:hypothetical protein
MKKLSLILILILCSGPLLAKDMHQRHAVLGVGGESCGNYLKARSAGGNRFHAYYDWITGYLSAFNLIVPNTYNILGERRINDALARLDDYCSTHQDEVFITALAMLTEVYFDERTNFIKDKDRAWGEALTTGK